MTEIDVHEAKTNLTKLLRRVENGESFSITNRGRGSGSDSPAS